MPSSANRRMPLAAATASAARRYWIGAFPTARGEIRRLRGRARQIPDRTLRTLALATQEGKWGNLEGAAAFAVLAPGGRRGPVARLLVGLQGIYDYADTLAEQPSESPEANAGRLHAAMLAALGPARPRIDYYAHHARADDGGYLPALVDGCRAALAELPSWPLVAEAALRHARRIVDYQRLINLAPEDGYPRFARWARRETPPRSGLRWWETAAACGSSTAVFALIASAADPAMTPDRAEALEGIYWPWTGALHTLLDSLIDHAEDTADGQHSLIGHYASPDQMTQRMRLLAAEAARRAAAVGIEHSLIVGAMTSLYLSDARARLPAARPAAERILGALGESAAPAMLILRARRLARRRRS